MMFVDPLEIEELLNRMDDDTDAEREDDLRVFLESAYPSLAAQNG